MRRRVQTGLLGAVMAAGTLVAAPPAEAQYFGRNKVQYESFKFSVLKTEHFDIYYYPEEELAVELAALMAERWYARLSRLLSHELSGRQILVLYANGAHFRQTNVLQGDISESTGGVTEILKRRMVLPFAGPLPETDHVLGHELVHAFQFDITGEGGGVLLEGVPAVMRMPLWFVEGMAEYLSVGPVDPNTAMWVRDAARAELPDVRKLQDPRFFPYRYGQALWSYIAGRWGDDVVGRILKAGRQSSGSLEFAFRRILRAPLDSVVADWHRATREYYEPLRAATDSAAAVGRLLIGGADSRARYNIAPSLSPDGRWIVFFSERDLFSINMFLADAETGKVERRIVETAVNPHFESIQFISSAGAWDREGRRFAFAGLSKGRPTISVYDVDKRSIVNEFAFSELGEIYHPTWSPDGRRIAFSGQEGGLSDLYLYDLETHELRRLTDDPQADLQPAWSPDGSRIAFVTDRFTSGLPSLMYGDYRLALMDPASGAITEVPAFDQGKHLNPQWGPDGSLYFVSDRNGVSNVYRRDMTTGGLTQVTNLYTGVSGIAALSPAMSVAAASGRIAVSVYENDRHSIFTIDDPQRLAGTPPLAPFDRNPAVLPPRDRFSTDLPALLANAFYGLPRDTVYPSEAYSARLGLDYIGQPSFAFAVDRFGAFVAGGASAYFSDVLGNHNLATALYLNGSFKDVGVLLGYANLSRRLNWAGSIQQTPLRWRYLARGLVADDAGNLYIREDFFDLRQITRSAGTSLAYPLNPVQRVEFSAGYLGVSFDGRQQTRIYTTDGRPISELVYDLPVRDPIHLGQAAAALVYDNSLFGLTSPMAGQRYRFEGGANIGTLDFYTGLADYRKYWMVHRPFTVAWRLLHFGRWGPDADNDIMTPLYLGYEGIIRGYDYNSADFFNECPATGNSCPAFERLFGSKMVVSNVELRAPLLGALGLGSGLLDFLPVELVFFGDAGLAWWNADLPADFDQRSPQAQDILLRQRDDARPFFLDGGTRKPIFSAGGGLRVNVFGALIFSAYYVYPFNRPKRDGTNKGGHIQFGFTPGF